MVKVIFKFDDFYGIGRNVLRIDRFIRTLRIKVTWGIIGRYAESWDERTIAWVKRAIKTGLYHFWNHGYTHDMREFESLTVEEAAEHIRMTQDVVKQKVGLAMTSFGAPCNAIGPTTAQAIEQVHDISMWFFGCPNSQVQCLRRLVEMEYPCGYPSFLKTIVSIGRIAKLHKYVVIQGHPNRWGVWQRLNFYLIVLYLKLRRCEFCFPNEVS